jgi:hypothetical protein
MCKTTDITNQIQGVLTFQWKVWILLTSLNYAPIFLRLQAKGGYSPLVTHTFAAMHNKTSCITKCVLSQLCSLFRHRKFVSFHKRPSVLYLNVTSSVTDFMFFSKQYLWHSRKRNGRRSFSSSDLPYAVRASRKFRRWTSLWHNHHNDYRFTAAVWKVGKFYWTTLCKKLNGLISPVQPSHYR